MPEVTSAMQEWVKTAPTDDFWFWAIGLLVAAIVGFFFAFTITHRKRIIEDTPTSKIRSAAQGYVELIGHGQLMEGQPVLSPLTGKPCTWYEFKVEERRQTGKRNEWKTIRKATSDELFVIKDETGECIIDPEGAKVTVADKYIWYGNSSSPTKRPATQQKQGLLRKLTSSFSIGVQRYRYTEKLLHSGESLYAIGLYKTVGGAGANFNINEDVRELVREWKTDTAIMMKKFDKNKDGEIDLQEWQNVRDEAYRQVMIKHNEQKTLPPVHLMGTTNDKRRPYILSAVAQDDLTRRLHYYSIASIVAFVVCGSLAAWLISLRLVA